LSISAISRRYAKALLTLGAEQQKVERYGEELAKIQNLFASEELLRLILESPTFLFEKKAAILQDLMEALALSDGMRNFLGLLLEKDRLKYLPQIEGDYRKFADDLFGLLRAQVNSATELNEHQLEAIRSGLEKQTGKKVDLTTNLVADLIGGVQVAIGGKVFDGSVKTQLKRIEDTLKKG
jgi:F-type H+-transporting ATPase subunit delta